jgi:hypothetical protein
VAATVDRAGGTTGGKLYLDGALVLTFDPTLRPGSVSNDGALRLGQPGISFNGDIDEVELFSRALTLTEVSQIFQADSSGKCKPAVVGVSDAPPSTNPMMALTNNPIRSGHTEIRLSLAQEERVEISVFDISGRVVYTTEPRTMAAGEHKIPWNATGANGRRLMGGIYFVKVRLSLSGVEITKKFVIIR